MSAWNIPPGPSPEEFFGRAREIQQDINSGVDGDFAKQHLVSRVLLRTFASPLRGRDGLFLVPHDLEYGPTRPLGLRGCAKQTDFLRGASRSAEALWGTAENHIGTAIAAARRGGVHRDSQALATLKDAMALHFVRSYRWRHIHDSAVSASVSQVRDEMLRTRGPMIDSEFRRAYGLEPVGIEAREIVVDAAMSEWMAWIDNGVLARASIEFMFRRIRIALLGQPLEVLHTPSRAPLLISDSPAITLKYEGTASRQMVALDDAHTLMLPIAPDCLVAISDTDCEDILPSDRIDFMNTVQVQ